MERILYQLKHMLNIYRKEPPKILGRWKIESCYKKIDNKIDLSNEDHCGPCGQYSIQRQQEHAKSIQKLTSKRALVRVHDQISRKVDG